jgi:DNA-binding NarL/FixJ family response regulator
VPVRVLIVEQGTLMGTALHQTLQDCQEIVVVGVVRTAEEALPPLRASRADVVVCRLETALGEEDAVLARLRAHALPVPIVVVLSGLDLRTWLRGYQAGIHGWICGDSVPDLLPDVVRMVGREGYCADHEAMQFLVEEFLALTRAARELDRKLSAYENPLNRLTGRQREILEHLAEGLMTRQIAERLYLSESTVKGHVTNLLNALGVGSRDDAIALARKFHPVE